MPAVPRAPRPTSTRTQAFDVVSPDGAVLALTSGTARGDWVLLPAAEGDVVAIGKAPDNDLVVPDDTISRYHARIARVAGRLEITDVGSRNGTRVGGVRVERAIVEPGSIVQFASVDAVVRVDAQGVTIAPSESERFGEALGSSIAMRRVFTVLSRAAPGNATILLLGETGTGKDVLARAVHQESGRRDAPFEVVDCGAISKELIESELFGHERGAFTGASEARAGAFERVGKGTLFLDEIGELPLDLQPKLLRVLESRSFRRVGGSATLTTDARIVAATTRDLAREVRRGRFREDLWFRLAVVPVRVPPLRERVDDIAQLTRMFLAQFDADMLFVSARTLAELRTHDWPGNARELRNVVERSVLNARAKKSRELTLVDLAAERAELDRATDEVFSFRSGVDYGTTRARVEAHFEQRYVTWLLARHHGNVSSAAREAQMDRKYLAELAKRHSVPTRTREKS
jgi:transcriptional regulator with GAF, ATPase, and Fis domain